MEICDLNEREFKIAILKKKLNKKPQISSKIISETKPTTKRSSLPMILKLKKKEPSRNSGEEELIKRDKE